MTTGSTIRDQRYPFTKVIVYPDGSFINQGVVYIGSYFTKTWTGSNWPATKPGETRYRLVLPSGRTLTKRLRSSEEGGPRVEDHPYSTSIQQILSNPYTLIQRVWTAVEFTPQGPRYEWQTTTTETSSSELGGTVTFVDGWTGNDDIALVGKLREKIAGSDFNMGVFLGEGREALTMLADSATKIFRTYRAVRRGNIPLAASILNVRVPKTLHRESSKNWLALQYGWLPLVGDAHSSAQFLAKQLEFPASQTYKVQRTRQGSVIQGNPEVFDSSSASSQKQIIARISEVNPYKLAGLQDPLSVAWELLPFSFVADWFIPIGNYLSARSLASATTGIYVTTKTTRNVESVLNRKPYADSEVTRSYRTSGYLRKLVYVDRTVSSSLDVGFPSFKSLGDVPSWKRAANAVALVIGMTKAPR